ncbi:MAG: RNA-binding cell elongation regulator Jag/EloR [Lachnospira sp.]|nr:RNA-binding cell elongation regulator Jag/EloR [Lachnospira sp.]
MEYIEVTGKSVEEAITNACTKLGIPSSKLDYEVIEKGSSGLFGLFNSKPAKIKAREKSEETDDSVKEEAKAEVKTETKAEAKTEVKKEAKPESKKEFKPEPKKEVKADVKTEIKRESKSDVMDETKEEPKSEPFSAEQKEEIKKQINAFLDNMFGAMNMTVNVDITFDDEENSVNIDLSGDNMGVLIGKRGQTLDSIQYLTSLVINKNSEKYVRIKLDTENYRKRRKETLESLAKNIAYKVKRSRRPVSLEPMNPYERRIIHSALQSDKFVSTRSEGEEPFRHVVVYLERENNNRYNR